MTVIAGLAAVNRGLAIVCGVVLLATAALIVVEVGLRKSVGGMLGGTDEISGYVLAGVATWGFAYALLLRAHIRIDIIHRRLAPRMRAALDCLAMATLCAVAALVAAYAWRVVAVTVERGARANTPLQTPLWIPQSIFALGWTWFALCAFTLLLAALMLLARGDLGPASAAIGVGDEIEMAE